MADKHKIKTDLFIFTDACKCVQFQKQFFFIFITFLFFYHCFFFNMDFFSLFNYRSRVVDNKRKQTTREDKPPSIKLRLLTCSLCNKISKTALLS